MFFSLTHKHRHTLTAQNRTAFSTGHWFPWERETAWADYIAYWAFEKSSFSTQKHRECTSMRVHEHTHNVFAYL